ncbi:glycosyltransferase [Pedobacter hartonius]|uniref:Glycosyltransferase involved in cell wall bisynthesis n=1 Tax=Pedobacter hartonius TaxID=425514 RepID=A0A1H4FQN0_9SPHI|nr:glycosyltransferase [Pedobacter hartonius]SEA99683.1 Glycosyltransferase involved in cell wall bisynthesis [Pedobacter hartonius]
MKEAKSHKKKIKILRVVTQAEVVIWHLKNFLDRSNDDFEVYIAGNDVSRYALRYSNVTFIDVNILRKISIWNDIIAFFHIFYLCLKLRPQIVHSIMPKAGLIAAFASFLALVPIRIHTFTGQVWSNLTGRSRAIYIFIDKLIVSVCTVCLTDSPSQSDFLEKQGVNQNGKPIRCIGRGSLSGVDLSRFDISIVDKTRNVLRKELGIAENDFVYIFLARKSITKGINELLKAFSQVVDIPNAKLLFIGPDESEGHLQKLYTQYEYLSDRIISLDKVDAHEKYLAVSDVLCLPSSSEGFGSIVIEAAAMGVPAIGFDIVGLVDSIAHNSTGLLVESSNADEFSKAMRYLFENPGKLREMKINGRIRILDFFSADVIYRLQRDFYNELLLKQ